MISQAASVPIYTFPVAASTSTSDVCSAFAIPKTYESPKRFTSAKTNIVTGEYTTVEGSSEFAKHFSTLQSLRNNTGAAPIGVDAPNDAAINRALCILRVLQQDMLQPTRIVATAEGGVAICFLQDKNYADIECLNSGVILGVISNKLDRPTVWEIDPVESQFSWASDRIRKFFLAQSSVKDVSPRPVGRPSWLRRIAQAFSPLPTG